jgi:hypothetical protein
VSSDLALALIGAGGVIAGGVVGAVSGVWGTAVSDRLARAERPRQAYERFIIATDKLHRLCPDPDKAASAKTADVIQDSDLIQDAYVAVLLAGPRQARVTADKAREAALAIPGHLSPQVDKAALAEPIKTFSNARDAFIKLAPRKLH